MNERRLRKSGEARLDVAFWVRLAPPLRQGAGCSNRHTNRPLPSAGWLACRKIYPMADLRLRSITLLAPASTLMRRLQKGSRWLDLLRRAPVLSLCLESWSDWLCW